MSTRRSMPGGRLRRPLSRGPNGRGLCRWCGVEVPRGRRTFCGAPCVHAWRLRSDPGYLRAQVLARDRGVCARCGLDTIEFCARFARLPARARKRLRGRLGLGSKRLTFWDADHVVPVAEGGGECTLDNLRTLCLWCHADATSDLRRRLTERRRAARGSLKGEIGSDRMSAGRSASNHDAAASSDERGGAGPPGGMR